MKNEKIFNFSVNDYAAGEQPKTDEQGFPLRPEVKLDTVELEEESLHHADEPVK